MDTELCGSSLLQMRTLIRDRTAVTERRVQPHSIVKPFNVVEHRAVRGRVAVEDADWQLSFESGEEALHRRVVPAVAFAAHRAAHLASPQKRLILGTCVLAASVTMMEQTSWWLAALQCVVECRKHQIAFQCRLH